jgi:hypothetical protein
MLASIAGLPVEALDAERAGFPAAVPWAFGEMLAAALAEERRAGGPRGEVLRRHYFEIMPSLRAAQLDPGKPPQSVLFHTRLDLARLPRLGAALDRLYALLARAGVPAERALPARAPAELLERFPTLADLYPQTYYGGFMPLLYGYPADLDGFARDLPAHGALGVIDRHLTAPLVHELAHFSPRRRALLPLYLDECVAGHLGVRVLPELAYPAPGDDNGLFAAPWLAQVGQALVRRFGLEAVVRAHAGVTDWSEVLPAGFLEGALRLGWDDYLRDRGTHFLSDNFNPDPWLKLIYLAEPRTREELERLCWSQIAVPPGDERPDDVEVIADALRACCLENFQLDRSYRVRARPATVRIDLAACRAVAPGGPHDPPELAHHVPPAWARRLGTHVITVDIRDPAEIPARAAVVWSGGS